MRDDPHPLVLYWDASALLSTLVLDDHTRDARRRLTTGAHNLVSSLAYAEVMAVLARIEREPKRRGDAPKTLLHALRSSFVRGPWRWVTMSPGLDTCRRLSTRHPLRGADLWHLAAAVTLQRELTELRMLTYDMALQAAARAENL